MKYDYYPEDNEMVICKYDTRTVTPAKVIITILLIVSYIFFYKQLLNCTNNQMMFFNGIYLSLAIGVFFSFVFEGNEGIFTGFVIFIFFAIVTLIYFGLNILTVTIVQNKNSGGIYTIIYNFFKTFYIQILVCLALFVGCPLLALLFKPSRRR